MANLTLWCAEHGNGYVFKLDVPQDALVADLQTTIYYVEGYNLRNISTASLPGPDVRRAMGQPFDATLYTEMPLLARLHEYFDEYFDGDLGERVVHVVVKVEQDPSLCIRVLPGGAQIPPLAMGNRQGTASSTSLSAYGKKNRTRL